MLNTIVIDDEPMSVNRLTNLLHKTGMVVVKAGFTDPEEALMQADIDTIDMAFIDIEMPGLTGLALAERFQKKNPALEVIMVTAHDHYALEAFKAHAVGYLLKPASLEDIEQQVTIILQKRNHASALHHQHTLIIKSFGLFQCNTGTTIPDYIKWRTAKAKELMAFLFFYRGSPVTRDIILDHLWPDMELDRGVKNFHATSYYLRETLKKRKLAHLFERTNGAYRVKWEEINSDEKDFLEAVSELNKGNNSRQNMEKIIALSSEGYLYQEDYAWSMQRKQAYESVYIKALEMLSKQLDDVTDYVQKLKLIGLLSQQDPYNEKIHETVVILHRMNGNGETARQYVSWVYRLFHQDLGIEPDSALMKRVNQGF